jgi:1-deoxy-D-xylulose-5-phosphate synthase
VHDVAIQNLPVKFAIDRAGLVGEDGPTHAGSFDVTYLSCLPNFVVMAASDDQELVNMVATAAHYDDGPIAFRYPRGAGFGMKLKKPEIIKIGKGRVIQEGSEVLVLSLGTRLEMVKGEAKEFGNDKVTIVDMRFSKPIDKGLIDKYIRKHKKIITVEEGSIGGFSAQVNDYLNVKGYNKLVEIKNVFLKDEFVDHGTRVECNDVGGVGRIF